MDALINSWFSEQGLDDSIYMDQCDFINEEFAAILGDDFPNTLFPGSNSSSSETVINIPSSSSTTSLCTEPPPPVGTEPPAKQRKTNLDRSPSVPIVLNFGNANSPENPQQVNSRALSFEEEAAVSEGFTGRGSEPTKRISRVRPASQTYDHIVAERKRRELLSQRFATLSGMVPGLTKMDKTSVLRDAIKYLNHLQDRVKTLEEQATKQTMESLVLVKKSQIMDEDNGSSDEKNECSKEQPLPEIEARICNNHILLRIQCEKLKGVLVKLLGQVEKLNLTVVSTNVLPFGNLALDITIIAEMEKESNVLLKEIVKVLHSALQRPG
ncbi:hypothetical protein Pfo_008537 [Paulownia fortunei]|nr:hypothetical protein Pfo_008537 [Paulownia fortunei]